MAVKGEPNSVDVFPLYPVHLSGTGVGENEMVSFLPVFSTGKLREWTVETLIFVGTNLSNQKRIVSL